MKLLLKLVISLLKNERAVEAAEKSAKAAQDAFYVGEAPWFGITCIDFVDLKKRLLPKC